MSVEILMLIATWCGMSTYSRANAQSVNLCRAEMIACMKKPKAKIADCAESQKLVD